MAAENIVSRLAKCKIVREATYGTTPGTTYDMRWKDPGPTLSLAQDNLANDNQSTRMWDMLMTIKGLKSFEVSGNIDIRPETAQLTSAATAVTTWTTEMFRAFFGGYNITAASSYGSAVVSASDGTAITITGGHGSRFTVGSWIAVGVAGVLEVAKVTAIFTDTLSLYPTLSGTPAAAQLVINGYNNYPLEANTETMAMTAALVQSSNANWTLNNIVGSGLDIKIDRKGLVTAAVKLMGKSWTGPSSQSLSTTAITEPLASPMPGRDAYFFLQASSTLTRVIYPIVECSFKLNPKPTFIEEFSGSQEQTSGVMNVGDRSYVTADIKTRFDVALETYYTSETILSLIAVIPLGSGTTKRFLVFEMPTCFINAKPKTMDESGRQMHSISLQSMLSAMNESTTVGTAAAPFVMARI